MSTAGAALREIIAKFELDSSGAAKSLEELDNKIAGVTQTLGALAEAFVGSAIVHGLAEFIEGQIEAGSVVNDLSEKLGVGTDELQAFQFAAGLAGVSAESAAKGLQFLNKNIGEALDGNKSAVETFAKLGITLKDSNGNVRETGDLLPEIADAFAEMGSDAERTATVMKVFGKAGADLLPMLKGGSEGAKEMLEEFNRLGGGLTKDFIKAADEAGDEVDKVKFAFAGWKSQIVFAILPAVTRVAKLLQEGVAMLRRTTKETNLAKGAWVLFGAGAAAATAKAAAGFGKLLGVIPKDAGFWKAALGLGEILLVIAAVALLYLAFDDLFTFLTGGESVIGDVIDSLFGVGASAEAVAWVRENFAQLKTELEGLAPLGEETARLMREAWTLVRPVLAAIAKDDLVRLARGLVAIVRIVHFLVEELAAALQLIGRLDLARVVPWLGLSGGDEKFQGIQRALAATGVNVAGAATKPHGADNTAWIPQRRRDGDTTINQTNQVTNNITGVKDAAAAGDAARSGTLDALEGELSDAMAGGG